MAETMSTGAGAWSHNGPVCTICGKAYVGSHRCTVEDIDRRIAELEAYRATLTNPPGRPFTVRFDPRTCACHPSNGGSGICGCVRGGTVIT